MRIYTASMSQLFTFDHPTQTNLQRIISGNYGHAFFHFAKFLYNLIMASYGL